MRLLLATHDCYSHVTTAFPLVQRLVRRGHTVRWLVEQRYRTLVERAGAELVPTMHIPSHATIPPLTIEGLVDLFQRERMAQAADLLAALADAPTDVVLGDSTMLGVDELGRDDYARLTIGMLSCVPLLHAPVAASFVIHPTLAQCEYPLGALRERVFFVGPLLPPPMDEIAEEEMATFGQCIPTDRPLILITHGTIATEHAWLAAPALEAIRDLPVFALVQGTPGLAVPDNALPIPWLPFGRLLPHTALMVSNGGWQGAQWCLAAGVPMVIHGRSEDKPEVGARVEWAGYGKNISGWPTSPESFRRAIEEVLLNPRYREQAQRLAMQAALMDSATAAAQVIESQHAIASYQRAQQSHAVTHLRATLEEPAEAEACVA